MALGLGLATLSAAAAERLLAPRQALADPVPVRADEVFSADEIRAGRAYGRPQRAIGALRTAAELTALVAVARRVGSRRPGGLPAPRRPAVDALGAGAAGAGLALASTLMTLPLSALARQRSLNVGLATQSWSGWAEDLAKATALEAGLTGTLLAGSSALADRRGDGWWPLAGAGAVGAAVLAGLLAPVLTDPLFNAFTPLPEGPTRSDVLALADAAGVRVGEVFEVDASRRSTAVNAYVNGLGPTKRVVLFDTLLADFSRDEVRFVVGHELGHVQHRDVPRQMAFLALCAPAAAYAVQTMTVGWAGQLTGPVAVPALSLSLSVVGVPIGLAAMALSRAVERRTDQVGLELSDAPEALISFFRRIAVQNRADVTAGRLTRGRLSTHPPITERIGAALAYARVRSPGENPDSIATVGSPLETARSAVSGAPTERTPDLPRPETPAGS